MLQIDAKRRAAGLKSPDITRHLVFVGNPGTGKTNVARMVGGIYRSLGLLKTGQLVDDQWGTPSAGLLSSTIPGWQTGLVGRRVGSRTLLVLPPDSGFPEGSNNPPVEKGGAGRLPGGARAPGPDGGYAREGRKDGDRRLGRPRRAGQPPPSEAGAAPRRAGRPTPAEGSGATTIVPPVAADELANKPEARPTPPGMAAVREAQVTITDEVELERARLASIQMITPVPYTHPRAHETALGLVCRLLL